jgi:hypothetical protein
MDVEVTRYGRHAVTGLVVHNRTGHISKALPLSAAILVSALLPETIAAQDHCGTLRPALIQFPDLS